MKATMKVRRVPDLPACLDCQVLGHGYVPCVRHGGAEHGFGPGPFFTGWDDSWEHWKRRALLAEAERDYLREAFKHTPQADPGPDYIMRNIPVFRNITVRHREQP